MTSVPYLILAVLCLSISSTLAAESGWVDAALKFLVEGNKALQVAEVGKLEEAIEAYKQGVETLPAECDKSFDKKKAQIILSLHTQLGQALSYAGDLQSAIDSFRSACICQREWSEGGKNEALNQLASKAYFSLGMAYQESASSATHEGKQREQLELSVRAYGHATKLDPLYWSSYANLGVILADVGQDGNGSKSPLAVLATPILTVDNALALKVLLPSVLLESSDTTVPLDKFRSLMGSLYGFDNNTGGENSASSVKKAALAKREITLQDRASAVMSVYKDYVKHHPLNMHEKRKEGQYEKVQK
eukprot:scaffold7555_cov134-Skeletonema_marinoi.AAC.3